MRKEAQNGPTLQSIAARVETELTSPAALLITSALAGDGTTMIAARIAETFIQEGYRVAVVDAREAGDAERVTNVDSSGAFVGDKSADRSGAYAEINLHDLRDAFAGSRRDVSALVARLRARYDYVIVNAPTFSTGSMPTLFADCCDALMICVLSGRPARAEDRRITTYLDTGGKPTIGIVSTTKAAIANFDAVAQRRTRSTVPLHDLTEERTARVPVITGAV
jgi:Mrp family chromosome partitioning ATPase